MLNESFIGLCLIMSNLQHLINILFIPIRYAFLYFSDWNHYHIERRDYVITLRKKLRPCICFKYDEDENPLGTVITYDPLTYRIKYITHIHTHKYEDEVDIYMTSCWFKKLFEAINYDKCKKEEEEYNQLKQSKEITSKNTNEIEIYTRVGDYGYLRYTLHKIMIDNTIFDIQQNCMYDKIIELYRKQPNVVSFIWGGVAVGKTFFSYILANKMEGSLCHTFRPTDPGESFECFYRKINPTKSKPLIILLDEIDVMLENIHEKKIIRHKKHPVSVYDKNTWNFFLDQFDYNVWRNVIIVMCSNKSLEEINKMDPAYLRKGRVHVSMEFK